MFIRVIDKPRNFLHSNPSNYKASQQKRMSRTMITGRDNKKLNKYLAIQGLIVK